MADLTCVQLALVSPPGVPGVLYDRRQFRAARKNVRLFTVMTNTARLEWLQLFYSSILCMGGSRCAYNRKR